MMRIVHILFLLAFAMMGFAAGCSDAIYVEAGKVCNYTQYSLSAGAGKVSTSDCGWVNKGYKEVWIKTKMPSTGHLSIRTEGHYIDGFMALYKGNCNSLQLIKCSNNGRLPENLDDNNSPSGTILYIRIALSDKYTSVGVCLLALNKIRNTNCNIGATAADLCSNATLIQSPKGYCGNTSSYYTPEQIDGMPFCGTIENNSWLKFVAAAETAELNVVVSDCKWGNGIQMNIYETDDCVNFIQKSNCWNPAIETDGVVKATGLTPGKTYYLMVDGYAGDVCNYVISAGNGVAMPQSFIEITICEGERYTQNGFDVSEPGIYRQDYIDAEGNEASKVLYLKVFKPVKLVLRDYFYSCQRYTKYGFDVNTEGVHYRYLKTKSGCDSIVELHLTAYEQKTLQLYDTIYSCQRYTKYGFDVNTTGEYTQTLKSVAGCDSLVELHLTVLKPDTTHIYANIYACERYNKNGFDTNEEGVHILNLQNEAGCDSVIILDLKVLPYKEKKITATICNGEPYKLNGFSESESGTYQKTFKTVLGCDSIVTLVLKVDDLHLKVDGNTDICRGDSVVLYASGGTSLYIWQDADGNEIGRGDSIIIKPTETTSYFLYSSSEIPEIKSVIDICGNIYPVVKIGEQYWMAENMRCEKYDTESEAYKDNVYVIPYYDSLNTSNNYYADLKDKSKLNTSKYAGYLTDEQIEKLGYYYSKIAAVGLPNSYCSNYKTHNYNYSEKNRQGICPNGWHIPSTQEFEILENTCDYSSNILKSKSGWYNTSEKNNGTDDFGFAALPAGKFVVAQSYHNTTDHAGYNAYFVSSELSKCYEYEVFTLTGYASYTLYSVIFDNGASSVRCIKNPELIVSPENIEFDYLGGSFDIKVNATTSWSASNKQPWVTLSSKSGTGKATISVQVAKNEQKMADVDTIYFVSKNGLKLQIIISRGGKPDLVTDICGNEYPVVIIGTQIWTGKNMKCNKYDTESEAYNAEWLTDNVIPKYASTLNDNKYIPYYSTISDTSSTYATYLNCMTKELINDMGYSYNWSAAVGVEDGAVVGKIESIDGQTEEEANIRQGICPNGWHVPTKDDWTTLINYIGDSYGTKTAIKLSNPVAWESKYIYNTDQKKATNEYGFSILPDGCYLGTSFWSSTSVGYRNNYHLAAYVKYDGYYLANIDTWTSTFNRVRCVKNTYIEESLSITPTQVIDGKALSTYTISSNTTWTAAADQEWIQLSSTSGSGGGCDSTINVVINKNLTGTSNVGKITVTTAKGKTASVTIDKEVTDACGNTYSAVIVGTQTWMGENLHCDKYSTDSEAYKMGLKTIPSSSEAITTSSYIDATDKNNWKSDEYASELSSEQISKLGYLYNWAAAVGIEDGNSQIADSTEHRQGICPSGWHLPTDDDWNVLYNFVDGNNSNELNSQSGWYSRTRIDKYNFEALPSGYVNYNSQSIEEVGKKAYIWSLYKTKDNIYKPRYSTITHYGSDRSSIGYIKSKYSVRCIKD